MKGFKNSTRTQYSMGGDVYAKGGMAKGAAKISKVMGEFKKGELHSGSKDGPKVTKPAQAKAIAMSEARKAGMKAPMKKNEGGKVGKMPPLGETMKSVRRLPPELTPEQMRALEDRFAEKKRPSLGDTMKSVRRLPKELTPEQMRDLEEGSKVRKYAEGGAVEPMMQPPMPPSRGLRQLEALRAKQKAASAPLLAQPEMRQPSVMEPPLMMEQPTPPSDYVGLIDNRIGPDFGKPMQPMQPMQPTAPRAGMLGGLLGALNNPRMKQALQQKMMQPQAPRRGLLGALNNPRIREDLQQAMMQPPPAGMAPVDPRNVTMMKKGGRTAMPKGKR